MRKNSKQWIPYFALFLILIVVLGIVIYKSQQPKAEDPAKAPKSAIVDASQPSARDTGMWQESGLVTAEHEII